MTIRKMRSLCSGALGRWRTFCSMWGGECATYCTGDRAMLFARERQIFGVTDLRFSSRLKFLSCI